MANADNTKVINEFKEKIHRTISDTKFIKLSFSKAIATDAPKNIYVKLIETKKGASLSCTLRFSNKDIVQNFLAGDEFETQLDIWIANVFKIVTLISSEEESVLLFNNKNKAQLRTKRVELKTNHINLHNKEKNYLIKEDATFLKLLSITSNEGKVFSDQQDKYRQINKYCEIMLSQFEQHKTFEQPEKLIRIVDMGSGKGYLTFALYYLLKEIMQLNVEITGIELREELCRFCNEQAEKLGWATHLRFAAMDIVNYPKGEIEVLIALHACDTATDIAIFQGIANDANLIVVAPCCHKQIRKEIKPKGPWKNILKNGILLEREAELLTDAIRALLLEREGYKTRVFEFISGEHTAKNLMITAGRLNKTSKTEDTLKINHEIDGLKEQFGINEHYLEKLLKGKS
jgi:SAM-dependent methyltransferase